MHLPRFTPLQLAVHAAVWLWLAFLVGLAVTNNLTVNPIQEMTLRTGKTALVLLMLSLACTPAFTVTGYAPVLKVRRSLGVYAFLIALSHLAIFVGLDYGFDLSLLALEFTQKRYILAGLTAFLILLPLALTSTKGWQRRLKKGWKTLHRFVYLAGVFVIVHYIWLTKNHRGEPLVWAALLAALLILRLPPVRRSIVNWRRGRSSGAAGSPSAHEA